MENVAGNNTWLADVTLRADSRIGVDAAGSTLTIDGAISGGFAVTKVGPGTLTYAGATGNTYSGLTTVNEGILILNKTGMPRSTAT